MRDRLMRRAVTGALVVVSLGLSAVYARADLPLATTSKPTGVEHRWVERTMGVLPYTEVSPAEVEAMAAAKRLLSQPPLGLISASEHGYAAAEELLALAESLRDVEPVIIGHELLVHDTREAMRVFVSEDGATKLVQTGPVQLLATPCVAPQDQGDKDAAEIAVDALMLAQGYAKGLPKPAGALVSAHACGYADAQGRHLVVRVDVDGAASYTTW